MKTSDKWTLHAKNKAFLLTLGLTIWTIIVIYVLHIRPLFSSMLFFHLLLLLNTYFSVRIFDTITPKNNWGQNFWDILLLSCLIYLPLAFNSSLIFIFVNTLLFVIATLKYIFLIPLVGFSKLFFKKIRIDTLGTLLCMACMAGVIFGFDYLSFNLWAITFFLANIYVLWYKPLYKLEHHIEKYLNIK